MTIRPYRGKSLNGFWVEGMLVLKDEYAPNIHAIISQKSSFAYPVYEESIGQYTGLTDVNGTNIYEGDIVDILTENDEYGVVTYEDGGFVVKASTFVVDFMSNINGKDVEIIGNAFDNPQLVPFTVDESLLRTQMSEPQNGWFGKTSDDQWFVIIRQPNSDEYLMVYEDGGYDVGTVSEVFDESERDFNRYGECIDGNKIIRLINTISFGRAKYIYEECPSDYKDVIWQRR